MTDNELQWVTIPGGSVTLPAGGYLGETAVFPVSSFHISRYPVTNAHFAPFVAGGGYDVRDWWDEPGWALNRKHGWREPRFWRDPEWSRPDHPVVGVSWYEAMAFCRWLAAQQGRPVTLPTEQQWQRAAQGDDGRYYPWGDADPADDLCNWQRHVDSTTPVTRYPAGASPFGVMDLCGNVWEWCATSWTGEAGGPRLLRGGCWSSDSPLTLRVTNRSAIDPNARLDPAYRHHVTVGFRCASPA